MYGLCIHSFNIKKVVIIIKKLGSPSEHRFSTQVMNICIVFNSFSVVLLQQRLLHFTLHKEPLSAESQRATKIVRGPRAHVF